MRDILWCCSCFLCLQNFMFICLTINKLFLDSYFCCKAKFDALKYFFLGYFSDVIVCFVNLFKHVYKKSNIFSILCFVDSRCDKIVFICSKWRRLNFPTLNETDDYIFGKKIAHSQISSFENLRFLLAFFPPLEIVLHHTS